MTTECDKDFEDGSLLYRLTIDDAMIALLPFSYISAGPKSPFLTASTVSD